MQLEGPIASMELESGVAPPGGVEWLDLKPCEDRRVLDLFAPRADHAALDCFARPQQRR